MRRRADAAPMARMPLLLVWTLAMTALLCAPVSVAAHDPRRLSDGVEAATPTPTPTRTRLTLTLEEKKELCSKDLDGHNVVLRAMTVTPERHVDESEVAPSARPYPRIFCYVNTISSYHKSHAQLVADTWGQRCDKLVFFSNVTGTMVANANTPMERSYDIIKMNAPADYYHLWLKHREVVQYVYDHYRHDYDWFYKADDDAYVIVDNFRAYLRRPEIVMNHKRQPMHLGKRFNLTADRVRDLIQDKQLAARWWKRWDRLVFNSGGPGYAMNRLFLDKFVASMKDKSCLSESWAEYSPEDTGTTYCMMWHDVLPWDTRDVHGRPRWHAANPGGEYGMTPAVAKGYWLDFHQGIGGLRWGKDCCATDSIGWHYIKGPTMYHMERMLYFCRSDDTVLDMDTYNRMYNLGISDKVLQPPP
jgi:glycoprotein-N-acetylgalactosamine 3-beta-galactosyltransferase